MTPFGGFPVGNVCVSATYNAVVLNVVSLTAWGAGRGWVGGGGGSGRGVLSARGVTEERCAVCSKHYARCGVARGVMKEHAILLRLSRSGTIGCMVKIV